MPYQIPEMSAITDKRFDVRKDHHPYAPPFREGERTESPPNKPVYTTACPLLPPLWHAGIRFTFEHGLRRAASVNGLFRWRATLASRALEFEYLDADRPFRWEEYDSFEAAFWDAFYALFIFQHPAFCSWHWGHRDSAEDFLTVFSLYVVGFGHQLRRTLRLVYYLDASEVNAKTQHSHTESSGPLLLLSGIHHRRFSDPFLSFIYFRQAANCRKQLTSTAGSRCPLTSLPRATLASPTYL